MGHYLEGSVRLSLYRGNRINESNHMNCCKKEREQLIRKLLRYDALKMRVLKNPVEDSHIKRRGELVRILKRTPKRYQGPVL